MAARLISEDLARHTVEFAAPRYERETPSGFRRKRYAQAGRLRRQNTAVTHAKRLAHDFRMQRPIVGRHFQDACVLCGKPAVHVLHQRTAGAPGVRRYVPSREASERATSSTTCIPPVNDASGWPMSKQSRSINVCHSTEASQGLAARDRNIGDAAEFRVTGDIRVVQRLLTEKQIKWLHGGQHGFRRLQVPNRRRTVPHVAIEHYAHIVSEPVANELKFVGLKLGSRNSFGRAKVFAFARVRTGADFET